MTGMTDERHFYMKAKRKKKRKKKHPNYRPDEECNAEWLILRYDMEDREYSIFFVPKGVEGWPINTVLPPIAVDILNHNYRLTNISVEEAFMELI